ncbi:arsenate reductase (glutaredoxin) [Variovorax dokdonensis]|uniref:Arsenate reductase n=1 Tax=Variovorax dokdonensis TaxID=344883 RepID=A0ABT7NDR4_9BURK|nr:arsenate reductase (glutaredoxin) [Variovorax dokdonensis]MDM0046092.1 arsenate reductase (glutaredoxin) [Variovorax dokdonensis]
MSDYTIYHNPSCSNSRKALSLLREHGIEPAIVQYLDNPPDADTLRKLLAQMGLPARELLRSKEAMFDTLGLHDPALTDDALIDAMAQHPILMNRPIVVSPKGTRLCRPGETVLELLPSA